MLWALGLEVPGLRVPEITGFIFRTEFRIQDFVGKRFYGGSVRKSNAGMTVEAPTAASIG